MEGLTPQDMDAAVAAGLEMVEGRQAQAEAHLT
jgi:hypothetical protein